MFKKVYVEITNICNLNCSFCVKNNRQAEYLNVKKFNIILKKLKGYTKYIYLHVMGEALLHPDINNIIEMGSNNYNVCITTNGYMIDKIKDNKNIYQLNISLHAFDGNDIDSYLNNIFSSVDKLLDNNTIVSYRIWIKNKYYKDIINRLEDRYDTKIDGNTKLKKNLYLEFDEEFIWPDLDNDYYNENGSCMALRTHFGILVSGDIVPCCLDYNGNLILGNIYTDNLDDILNKKEVKKLIEGFKNNKKINEFCRHCNFYDRKINKDVD